MANFKVSQNSNESAFNIKINSGNNFKISQEKITIIQGETVVSEFLSDLADVAVSNLPESDNYVLTYNASIQKYTLVSADQVLQSAVEDAQLPQELVDQLDVDLDDKIDLDAGTF